MPVQGRKLRDLTLSVHIHQRYRIIDYVRRGFGLVETATRVGCHFTVAYDWVHRFNQSGLAKFEQVPNPKGRPPILKAPGHRAVLRLLRRARGLLGRFVSPAQTVA